MPDPRSSLTDDAAAAAAAAGDDMKQQQPKPAGASSGAGDPLHLSRKLFSTLLIASVVCLALICLYYGSSFAPGLPHAADEASDPVFNTIVASSSSSVVLPLAAPKSIPVCDMRYSELIPCLDRELIHQLKLKVNLDLMEHYERHCPSPYRRYNCLIPPPAGYRIPIRWPESRDEVWKANIPHTSLASNKSDQNWMVVKGEKINFPGGGTHFHKGADKYIVAIAQMLKFPGDKLNNAGNIRTVLDVGCGVASFGAYLLSHNVITMSLAPNDVHENQIQFALERGIPSMLGVLGSKRLPYPSRSFELVHCSRCRIDWLQRDGILLLELDRLLRPGGYFVYSSPEIYDRSERYRRIGSGMLELLAKMCWKVASRKNQTVIWSKPVTNGCYKKRAPGTLPPLCASDDDPDAVWDVPMQACITPYSRRMSLARGSELVPWPQRLKAPPPRLVELGISTEKYHEDNEVWNWRVSQYWEQMKSETKKNSFRNIMDMRANLGGFAAALADEDVWVMNVVPVNESSKLKIIYDRGLIGTVHNWCEAFSTYPRTYDLLHVWQVFSELDKEGCSLEDLLIEMDRILRPLGFAIIRDEARIINYIRPVLTALRWDSWSSEVTPKVDALSLASGEEKVLIVRKRLWKEGIETL